MTTTSSAVSSTDPCYHCGEPLPPDAPELAFDGARRRFCCTGCAGAAAFIRDQGLADYYRLRSRDAARVEAGLDYSPWDREDLLAEHARLLDDGSREITVLTDGMRCAACAWLIDRVLRREPGVVDVGANAVTGRIRLTWRQGRQPLSALLARLAALGYAPQLAPGAALEAQRLRERRQTILRLGVAGLGMLQAMMFAEALYLDTAGEMAVATRDFFRWIAALVALPVVFYSGWPFLRGMLRELASAADGPRWLAGRRPGMDTLIATAVLAAWSASVIETIRGGAHVWFDAAVMFVFLLLAARALEQFARRRANAVVDQLGRARPALARRLRADGTLESVPLAALAVGDVVSIAAGESLPADGTLLDAGDFDEALLTGEARPVAHAAGDRAFAGSLCLGRPVRLTIAATGPDTRLSELVRLVERAQAARPKLAQVAERWSTRFVLALFGAAAVTFAGWSLVAPARAFEVALAVLVVSCPCALALAIPAGLAVANGALAKLGMLALTPDAIDRLAGLDALIVDKTGTLTEGRPRLVDLRTFGSAASTARAIAAALERDSGHPLAAAFADDGARRAEAVVVHAGCGVEGVVDGRRWRIGTAPFAARLHDDGAVWLGDGRIAFARFVVDDPLRADAAATIAALRALGVTVELASGDADDAVAAVADRLGIDERRGRCTPEAKLARLRALQAAGHRVGMLGDGINDAPVLAGADVSIALASGASLAHRAADLVLTGGALGRLPQAIALARRTRTVLRQNFAWAIGYNLIALPFAAAGVVAPWLAALGMTASSLLVTANALRLARPAEAGIAAIRAAAAGSTPELAAEAAATAVQRVLPGATA